MDIFQAPADQQSAGSDSGFIDNPQYQPQQPQSTAGSDFVDNPAYTDPEQPRQDALSINPNDGMLKKGAKAVGGLLEGVGEGVFGTVAGVSDIANHIGAKVGLSDGEQGAISKGLHDLAGDNEQRSTAALIGYGGESLMEMMLGDEALKALPLAQKLGIVSKAMGWLEKSPKLMVALKTGANLMKNSSVLGNPIVQEAIKAAMMQGVQTTVKTGGDVGQGAEDALTAGAIGGGLGVAGKVISKAGKAAKTVLGLSEQAGKASSADSLFTGIADHVQQQKDDIQAVFDQAKSKADAALQAGSDAAEKTFKDRKSGAEVLARESREQIADRFNTARNNIEQARQSVHAQVKQNLVEGLDKLAGQEPDDVQALAKKVDEGINKYEEGTHTNYEAGMNGEEGIVPRLGDQTMTIKGSESAKAAKSALNVPDKNDHILVSGMKKLAGEKLSAETKNTLEMLANGEFKVKAEDGTEIVKQVTDMTPAQLLDLRQSTRKAMAGFPRGDANRIALNDVLKGIDKDVDALAEKAHDPSIGEDYRKLKGTYREQRALLDSDTADALRLHSPDDAMSNVNQYLLQGKNGPAKINTVRKLLGEDGMQQLSSAQIGYFKGLAEQDPAKFLREYGKIDSFSASSLFGPETKAQLDNLAHAYSQGSEFADTTSKSLLSQYKDETKGFNDQRRKLYGNTGPGERQLGGLVGEGIKGERKAALDVVQSKYNSALDAAKDVLDKNSEKFDPSFVKRVSNGNISDALLKGQVDPADIRNLSDALGSKWEDVSQGIFQRAVADSSPKGRFDPQKMMEWWNNIDPKTRAEMFVYPNQSNMFKVSQVMNDVKDAAQVKHLFKWLGVAPTVGAGTIAAGGIAGEVIGTHVLGELGKIIGGISGSTGSMGAAKMFVEWVANHPNTWKTFKGIAEATDAVGSTSVGKAARKVAPYAANSTMQNVYSGLAGSL